ncbi:MAG: hypothetical protein ACTSP4_15085 [Candidatus Hodarchaeales archaeon]
MVNDKKDEVSTVLIRIPDYFLLLNMQKLTGLGNEKKVSLENLENDAKAARELIIEKQDDISPSKLQKLLKICKLVDLEGDWTPYTLNEACPSEKIKSLAGKSFPVEGFTGKSKTSVSGVFHVHKIYEQVFIIAAEFKSRSISQRKIFRYLFLTEAGILLSEVAERADDFLKAIVLPRLTLTADDITLKKINARIIRRIAKKFTPIRLSFMISIETAGVEGLSYITLEGDNVIRGMETLKSRQEFDLDPSNLGPWVVVETETVKIAVKNPIKVKKATPRLYETLSYALT